MIIDDKVLMALPPPPYPASRPGGSTPRALTSLPPHILLQIIHHTFPQGIAAAPYQDTHPERQRKTLFWLSTSLRLVSRTLYTACMHVLRSTYLPAYQALIRPPYSTDPFPVEHPTASPPAYDSPPSPLITLHRETAVLDRFILLKVRQDVFLDDTSLHIDREDAFRDLFDVAQPRARLEDLVRIVGARQGVVYSGRTPNAVTSSVPKERTQTHPQPQTPKPRRSFFAFLSSTPTPTASPTSTPSPVPTQPIHPIPFPALSVSFSPRRVGLILNRTRTVAEVARVTGYGGRGRETLEELAGRLVGGLEEWLVQG